MKQYFSRIGQDATVHYRFIENFREGLDEAIVNAVLN